MKIETIDYDNIQKKDVVKLIYNKKDLPKLQLFSSNDVIIGNPLSNIAVIFIYSWENPIPSKDVSSFFQKVSNYAAITGYWRTTNGGKYAFANLLSNPNINKLVAVCFDKDNSHYLLDSLRCLWKYGIDKKGMIKKSKASNPKFEQVPNEALDRATKQMDLVILKKVDKNKVENTIRACYQEPKNAVTIPKYAEFYSKLKINKLYDDGARFTKPYTLDLSKGSMKSLDIKYSLDPSIGFSLYVETEKEALNNLISYMFDHGYCLKQDKKTKTMECRNLSITISNPKDVNSKKNVDSLVKELKRHKQVKFENMTFFIRDKKLECYASFENALLAEVSKDIKSGFLKEIKKILGIQTRVSKSLKINKSIISITILSGTMHFAI